ncbi:MAG: hydantoinase B/oxoprolinase family protein [Cyanobacteria bacterium]|nr:hydantoinase B/oxoprolinase family protein [Cyanobacteriota bacterium]
MPTGWRFAIDRGGTFTDLVGRSPEGRLVVRKVLSVQPQQPGDPAIRALKEVLQLEPDQPLPPGLVEEVRLGTTVATNALLERQLEPVLLLVNSGFADLPRIGDQHRPDIFALQIERPEPLAMRVIEVDARLAADGAELVALQLDGPLEAELRQAMADGYRQVAVALMHSYRHPIHELALGRWLEQLGFGSVLLSHQLSRQPRIVPRLETTVVEAAVRPILQRYLDQVGEALGAATRLRVMTSGGALQAPAQLQAKDTILSGPAGGMVAAVAAARAAGCGDRPIVGFDMGGTSTDVFHFDGSRGEDAWERASSTEIAGLQVQAAMLPIHTVAAGGGSLLRADGRRLLVGPQSAGSDPGPACYRRGGPLTVTDANLLLGRLPPGALPAVFGPCGDLAADAVVVRQRFVALASELGQASGDDGSLALEQLAQGALTIAHERMAEAIRRISIQRGHDIRGAVLVCYGGAGGQHGCALAASLGIQQVLIHPLAGVLSAWGIGLARQSQRVERCLRQPLEALCRADLLTCIKALSAEARGSLEQAGDLEVGGAVQRRIRLELRYPASDAGLEMGLPEPLLEQWQAASDDRILTPLRAGFETLHRRRFGYVVPGEPLVLERIEVELVAEPAAGAAEAGAKPSLPPPISRLPGSRRINTEPGVMPVPPATTPLCLPVGLPLGLPLGEGMAWHDVPLWRRDQLSAGQCLVGPALVIETTGATVLETGWSARVLEQGELLLERIAASAVDGDGQASASESLKDRSADPVTLELYNHRFSAIAEQMGVRLQQSSRSVNIRERLDFSCALFDGRGRLVANAPHIPVHLGSMGESVEALMRAVELGALPPLAPGDAVAANNPYNGGTHLPDITVITPVFATDGSDSSRSARERSEPLFYVACRGHHADVGGITPGSMPPFSHDISEEGLLLDNVPLISRGQLDEPSWRQRLLAGRYPVRNPDQLLADLQAQVAANRLGVAEIERLMALQGEAEVSAYMTHVQTNAAAAVRDVIDRLHDGEWSVELDDGGRIQVAVRIDHRRRRALVDFSGTSPQQAGNGNAPLAITKSAVLYVFRCLVGQAIPLNAGCFEPIDLVVPRSSLLHPDPPAAVVAGNVETSQAVVNALFGALGVMAAAQGTMNNLSFGNDRCQYYETICGGTGAGVLADGQGFGGASAVQSHMTNSRLTDPEILEARFPVRLERFAIRRGSGGAGRWRGGDGVVRWLRFLEPMTAAIISGSRRVAPFGLAGGRPGRTGFNSRCLADGSVEALPGSVALSMAAGDVLRVETPGGGGYGPAVTPQQKGSAGA